MEFGRRQLRDERLKDERSAAVARGDRLGGCAPWRGVPSCLSLLTALRAALVVWACLLVASTAWANHHDGFEGDDPSWTVRFHRPSGRLLSHRRHRKIWQAGQRAENIEFDSFADNAEILFEHPLPAARLIEELTASLYVQSNRPGLQLAVRVVFPFQKIGNDGYLRIYVEGETYTNVGSWQQLSCRDIQAELRKKLPIYRKQYLTGAGAGKDFDQRGLYVDQIIVRGRVGRGTAEFFLDELDFGPVVSISGSPAVMPVGHEDERPSRELEQRLDRLVFQGRPYFPRIVASHGESAAELAAMRFNLAWIPDHEDQASLATLKQHGLRGVATPRRPRSESGELLSAEEANLAPFGPASDGVAIWMLGSEIPGSRYEEAIAWAEQVRNADRRLGRPVTADVMGRENSYSRELGALGVSRRVVSTSFGFREYRDWLIERRNTAQPGTLLWTTVQTEPRLPATPETVPAPVVIEPELIRLQVYSALAAGYRGICYWTDLSLSDPNPEIRERALQISQLNMEIELLEPWLATGKLQAQTRFTAALPKTGNFGQLNTDFGVSDHSAARRTELLDEREDFQRRMAALGQDLQAATLQTDYGQLLLPVWYGDKSQFVPDQLAANEASIIIPGATESASVYEVSTTEIRNISPPRKERVAGGLKITLDKFDLTAAVVLSEDRALIERLRSKMEQVRPRSAEISLELAKLKLARVVEVDARLHRMGHGQADSARLLASAKLCIDRGEALLAKQQYHEARLLGNNCLQLCRILQRAYWNDAVRALKGPVITSPYLVCFQTIPEHWELLERFGRSSGMGRPLLESGHFEDFDRLVAEGLTRQQTPIEGIDAGAFHHKNGRGGTYCLQLAAAPALKQELPRVVSETPVQVRTGPVRVEPGQVVHIEFWVRIPRKLISNLDGLVIYDSVGGAEQGLRLRDALPGWTKFQLLREVRAPSDLTVTIALAGLGEVLFDDLAITVYDPPTLANPADVAVEGPPVRMSSPRPNGERLGSERANPVSIRTPPATRERAANGAGLSAPGGFVPLRPVPGNDRPADQ